MIEVISRRSRSKWQTLPVSRRRSRESECICLSCSSVSVGIPKKVLRPVQQCLSSRTDGVRARMRANREEAKLPSLSFYMSYHQKVWPIFRLGLLNSNDLNLEWVFPPPTIQPRRHFFLTDVLGCWCLVDSRRGLGIQLGGRGFVTGDTEKKLLTLMGFQLQWQV